MSVVRHPPLGERERSMVAMALAEAGYPEAAVWIVPHPRHGRDTVSIDWIVPMDVAWRAYTLIDSWESLPCFECWKRSQGSREEADCAARGARVLDCGGVA